MLSRIADFAIAGPRRIIAGAALIMVACAIFGIPVANSLSAGGFQDPASESARATGVLTEKFDQTEMQMLITVTAPSGADSATARTVAIDIVDHLRQSPNVATVTSAWTAPQQAAADLVTKDGRSGLIVAGIRGGEDYAPTYATAGRRSDARS